MPKAQGMHRSKESHIALREARKSCKLTQAQVAAKLDVDTRTVSRWENGKSTPEPYARRLLCKLYSKNEEELGFTVSKKAEHIQEDHTTLLEEGKSVLVGETSGVSLQEAETVSLSNSPSSGLSPASSLVQDGGMSSAQKISSCHGDVPSRVGKKFSRREIGLGFGAVLALVMILAFLPNLGSSLPIPLPLSTHETPVQSTLRQVQQNCMPDSNVAGYLKIFTRQSEEEKVFCFSGTGSLSISLGSVRKVEVGNSPAQWTYLNIAGEQHLTPMSGKPNLYWCPGNTRSYSDHAIRILKITIASQASQQKCTNGEP